MFHKQNKNKKGMIPMKNKKRGFSKNLLIADYVVTVVLIVAFFICSIANGVYVMNATNEFVALGHDISMITITPPFNLDGFGLFFSTWTAQLAISSYAYYSLVKRERKIEMPMKMLETVPDDIKDRLDMTSIFETVLTNTND